MGYIKLLSDSEMDDLQSSNHAFSFWFQSTETDGESAARLITRDINEYFGIVVQQDEAFPQDIIFYYDTDSNTGALNDYVEEDTNHNIIINYDITNNNVDLLFDGDLINSYTWSGWGSAERDLLLGADSSGENQFSGVYSSVKIYDHYLSQKEINKIVMAKNVHYKFDQEKAWTKNLAVNFTNTDFNEPIKTYSSTTNVTLTQQPTPLALFGDNVGKFSLDSVVASPYIQTEELEIISNNYDYCASIYIYNLSPTTANFRLRLQGWDSSDSSSLDESTYQDIEQGSWERITVSGNDGNDTVSIKLWLELVNEGDFSVDDYFYIDGLQLEQYNDYATPFIKKYDKQQGYTYTYINDIQYGYQSGDIVFTADQWNGTANPGEVGISGTSLVDWKGNSLTLGDFNYGVALQDAGTATGYIMYSAESVHTRFSTNAPHTDNADHFIGVYHDGSNWKYDNNSAFYTFTPVSTDILVADLEWGVSSVSDTEGEGRSLGSSENLAVDNEEKIFDVSGMGNNTMILDKYCPAWSSDSPVGTGSYKFSSERLNYIQLPTDAISAGTKEISIAFWNYGRTVSNSTLLEALATAAHSTARLLNIYLLWGDNKVYWDCGTDGTNYDRVSATVATVDFTGWHYWIFTKNVSNGTMAVYKDNTLVASGTGKTKDIVEASSFYIGNSVSNCVGEAGSNLLDNSIADFRIYNHELSAHEREQLYSQRFSIDSLGSVHLRNIEERSTYDLLVGHNNLIENGYGEYGNNYNFTDFSFYSSDGLFNSGGFIKTGQNSVVLSDNFIQVNAEDEDEYELNIWIKKV